MNKTITFNNKKIVENEAIVEEIFLFQDEKYFPEFDMICKLHKRKTRTIKIACLESHKYLIYHIGQYKYYDENVCKWRYITENIPGVLGKRRYDNSTIFKSVEPVLRDEMTISYAAHQGKNLLNLTTVPSTIWRWLDLVDVDECSYNEMEDKVLATFSGHLSVDEVYDNGDGIVFITDPVSDTILSGTLIEGKPGNEDIITEFTKLKDKGIKPKSCVRDGSPLYMNTITSIFSAIVLQICIFHLIKNCLRYFLDWHREIRQEVKSSLFPRGLKGHGSEIKKFLFKTRYLFVKKDLSVEEEEIVSKIIESFPEFGLLRLLYLKFMNIFSADTKKEAIKRFWDFMAEPLVGEKLVGIQKQLMKYYKRDELFQYLLFDKEIRTKIRTSNHTERVNRTLRKKQKIHYRIRLTVRRKKMIRLMIYFHNMKSLGLGTNIILLLFFAFLRKRINLKYL